MCLALILGERECGVTDLVEAGSFQDVGEGAVMEKSWSKIIDGNPGFLLKIPASKPVVWGRVCILKKMGN